MVLHDHQANPHVHLSVKAESKHGQRLNPRKADLHRWREVFAERLRAWGVDAEATRQPTRGEQRDSADLWRGKAKEQGRLREADAMGQSGKSGPKDTTSRRQAVQAWAKIAVALRDSSDPGDRAMSQSIENYLSKMPLVVALSCQVKAKRQQERQQESPAMRVSQAPVRERTRQDIDIEC
jgi:hypothetical protein